MPIIGERSINKNNKYSSKLNALAAEFRNKANSILKEQKLDIFQESAKVMMDTISNDTIKNFFVENSYDPEELTADEINDHIEMMEELYKNDRESVMEYAAMQTMNPVIGMTFPIHKNILMNCIFDKGAIPKAVAKTPKFTESLETRYLVSPDGEKIDIYKEQRKIKPIIDNSNPFNIVEVSLPFAGMCDGTNSTATITNEATGATVPFSPSTINPENPFGAFLGALDNLDISTYIAEVHFPNKSAYVYAESDIMDTSGTDPVVKIPAGSIYLYGTGDTTVETDADGVWLKTDITFGPSYGEYDRTFVQPVKDAAGRELAVLTGTMKDNVITVTEIKHHATETIGTDSVAASIPDKIRIKARKDPSNGLLRTPTVKWDVRTDIIEIPNANPINVPISPEEVKDISALYQINQLDKIMSMINLVLENYKDDTIKVGLDKSFAHMAPDQKVYAEFDFAPKGGYLSDHIDWRRNTFMDAFDTYVTDLLTVLNDQNVTITVFGRPDIIRKITPTEYTYTSPSNIGPVELEFSKTIVTSDRRIYNFISAQKLQALIEKATGRQVTNNELIIILKPRNTDRFIYRIYDYQMYVSNEIRNPALYTLPSVHAFERFKFCEYQPVQGRVKVLNPTGLREGDTDASVYNERSTIGTTRYGLVGLN